MNYVKSAMANDCAITAMASEFQLPYTDVVMEFEQIARELGFSDWNADSVARHGTPHDITARFLSRRGYHARRVPRRGQENMSGVVFFRYSTKAHAALIRQGKVYDNASDGWTLPEYRRRMFTKHIYRWYTKGFFRTSTLHR